LRKVWWHAWKASKQATRNDHGLNDRQLAKSLKLCKPACNEQYDEPQRSFKQTKELRALNRCRDLIKTSSAAAAIVLVLIGDFGYTIIELDGKSMLRLSSDVVPMHSSPLTSMQVYQNEALAGDSFGDLHLRTPQLQSSTPSSQLRSTSTS